MISILAKIGIGIIALGNFLVTGNIYKPTQPVVAPKEFGTTAFTPVGAVRTTLSGAGTSLSASSIILQSLKTPDGTKITMTNFGTIGYGTLEPGTSKEESISFTGITQNGDGTATLTGVSRGLLFVYPYTASSTLQQTHAGGTSFVISNTPAFYNQFNIAVNDSYVTGVWTFASNSTPRASSTPDYTAASGLWYTTKNYVDTVATSGAANADATTKGLVQLSSTTNVGTGVGTGSTGASLVIPGSFFNSTSSATTTVPVTKGNGKLSQGFLDLTEPFTFSGGVTSTGVTALANTKITGNFLVDSASSSINATTTFNQGINLFGSSNLAFSRVTSTFNFTTATTTFALIGGTTTSLTLVGNHRVMLNWNGPVSNDGVNATTSLGWVIDGVQQTYPDGYTSFMEPTSANAKVPISMNFITDKLTAGTHTFAVWIHVTSNNAYVYGARNGEGYWTFSLMELDR